MIADTFAAVDSLCKSFEVGARKAASAGFTSSSGGPYASSSAAQQQPFADQQSLASAAKQYGALRDIPYTAIRPIAVKVASQEVMLGYKATDAKKLSPDARKLRTKSAAHYELAPPFLKKKIAEGLDPVEDHFLLDALESPNPYMSGWALKYCAAMSLSATGDAFWLIDRGPAGEISGFWYLPKTWITPIHTPAPFSAYKVRPPGEPERDDIPPVPAADMIHFRYPDPGNPLSSMAPLQTQARAVNTDDEIQKAQFASMRNSINPSVILRAGRLETPPGTSGQGPLPVLTAEQRRQLIDTIRLHYAGSSHFGDPIIIDGMIEGIDKFRDSPAELDFPQGSALTKERIMQGLGVNPIVAGQIQDANRASAYVAHQGFYDLVVNPMLALMSATLTARLSSSDPTAGRKLYIWLEEARAEDEDLNLAKMTMLAANGAVTKNEMREFGGLKKSDDPEADKLPKPPPAPLAGKPPGASTTKPPGKKKKFRLARYVAAAVEAAFTKAFNSTQPRIPAGSPAGGQFSSNHAAASSRILSKIDAALSKGDPVFGEPLKPNEIAAFRSAFSATLGGLNEKAITSLEKNLEDAHFYPNAMWLTHKIAGAKHAQEGKTGIHGAWEYSEQTGSGKLHLDGGVGDKATRLTPDAIRHVYAHEVAHAIDWVPDSAGGGGHAISSTTKWGNAYAAELKSGSLSTYATTSASEGFAEFGRLVNHSPVLARERFPKCAAVWAEHGILD